MRFEIEQIITQIFSFLFLLWVLKKFAWKPLLKTLDERKQRIQSEVESIDAQKKELAYKQREYGEKLKHIETLALAKMQEAVEAGRKKGLEIEKEAQNQAREIITKAKEEMHIEVESAKETLRKELVNMTLLATQKTLQEHMQSNLQQDLVEHFIKQVESK